MTLLFLKIVVQSIYGVIYLFILLKTHVFTQNFEEVGKFSMIVVLNTYSYLIILMFVNY